MNKFEMHNAWGELERGQKIDYALITVNEIIEAIPTYTEEINVRLLYWKEVKTELENL